MNKKSLFAILMVIILITACTNQEILPTSVPTNPSPTEVPTAQNTQIPDGTTVAQIQGESHFSPLNGQKVFNVQGIVTQKRGDGFYMQSPTPDNNPATSEGIFVFTQSLPAVKTGDLVLVNGEVDEFFVGGASTNNLPITEIISPKFEIISSDNPLPAATILGKNGRVLPDQIIDDDLLKSFDPETDGIDFFESLESMLVTIEEPLLVSPTTAYREFSILPDNGEGYGVLSPRGGLVLQENDANPERIILDDSLAPLPDLSLGDQIQGPLTGIIDYTFGNYKLQISKKPVIVQSALEREVVTAAGDEELTVVAYNVENLDALDNYERFQMLAEHIVNHLNSPDIIVFGEIQDNNGAKDTDITDASLTYSLIIQAIQEANGPQYSYRDIAPERNQDGGETGGNIRVGFLFREDRGLKFVDRPGGDAVTPVKIIGDGTVHLSASPARINPGSGAFTDSRKPLIGEFTFGGQTIFVIGNHLNSKGGDTGLFGLMQPPVLSSESQRVQQAVAINTFIKSLLASQPDANIIVLGDMNDFPYSPPMVKLAGNELTNLVSTLPIEEQYTYNYDGNFQVLDQILISKNMLQYVSLVDIIHLNSEYYYNSHLSDHDPVLVRLLIKK